MKKWIELLLHCLYIMNSSSLPCCLLSHKTTSMAAARHRRGLVLLIVLVNLLLHTANEGNWDVRISKGNVGRESDEGSQYVRITAISDGAALTSDVFQYSAPFRYRWTDKYLNTGLMLVKSGSTSSVTINSTTFEFYVPWEGEGVRGVLIADPCYNNQ